MHHSISPSGRNYSLLVQRVLGDSLRCMAQKGADNKRKGGRWTGQREVGRENNSVPQFYGPSRPVRRSWRRNQIATNIASPVLCSLNITAASSAHHSRSREDNFDVPCFWAPYDRFCRFGDVGARVRANAHIRQMERASYRNFRMEFHTRRDSGLTMSLSSITAAQRLHFHKDWQFLESEKYSFRRFVSVSFYILH